MQKSSSHKSSSHYADDEADGLDSQFSGEKAVYDFDAGSTVIVDTNEDELRNIDDVIELRCRITKPKY